MPFRQEMRSETHSSVKPGLKAFRGVATPPFQWALLPDSATMITPPEKDVASTFPLAWRGWICWQCQQRNDERGSVLTSQSRRFSYFSPGLIRKKLGRSRTRGRRPLGSNARGLFFASGPAVLFVCLHCVLNAGIHATTEARQVDGNFGDFRLEGNER